MRFIAIPNLNSFVFSQVVLAAHPILLLLSLNLIPILLASLLDWEGRMPGVNKRGLMAMLSGSATYEQSRAGFKRALANERLFTVSFEDGAPCGGQERWCSRAQAWPQATSRPCQILAWKMTREWLVKTGILASTWSLARVVSEHGWLDTWLPVWGGSHGTRQFETLVKSLLVARVEG